MVDVIQRKDTPQEMLDRIGEYTQKVASIFREFKLEDLDIQLNALVQNLASLIYQAEAPLSVLDIIFDHMKTHIISLQQASKPCETEPNADPAATS